MFKKVITYSDFDGNARTDTLYFNLSTTEFYTVMQGLKSDKLDSLVQSGDVVEMLRVIQNFVLASYGEKSDDGKRFLKNDAIREDFAQSAAYDALIEDFLTNGETAYDFIRGLIPAKLSEAMTSQGFTLSGISEKIQNGTIRNSDDFKREYNLENPNIKILE